MLSDLLKINFAKDKPVSTNLDGNMFVDVDTHKNKMIKSNGLDDLNVKMNITKIKPADGKITGCSDMDQLKTTGSYKAKFESNPYAFMGLDPELSNIKIPAPYFWRVPNDKELMISRMQNEAGFDNPFRAKLNNYQSDGIIDIQGNINPNDVKVQGREQSFQAFLAALNEHKNDKIADELNELAPLDETLRPPRAQRKSTRPLQIQSVDQTAPLTLTTDERQEFEREQERWREQNKQMNDAHAKKTNNAANKIKSAVIKGTYQKKRLQNAENLHNMYNTTAPSTPPQASQKKNTTIIA